MNPKIKSALASWARSFLAAGLTAYSLGKTQWQDILVAGILATFPVILRALNPEDRAFGLVVQEEIVKKVSATKKK